MCADVFMRPTLLGFHSTLSRATIRPSQNNRNVGTCWAKSLIGFKLYATSTSKCQHCCGSMPTDATSHNIVGPNNVGCSWPIMLRPFAWALSMSLSLSNCAVLVSVRHFLSGRKEKNRPGRIGLREEFLMTKTLYTVNENI